MKFNKVICLYPYFQEVPIYEFFPPLGLEFIAGAIKDFVRDICIIDLRYEKNFRELITDDVDLLCISVNWHYETESVIEIIRSLPKDIMTVVGGKYATENVEELFSACPNIDIIVRGDGEETMREFITSGSPEQVSGISYRHNGNIIHNENRLLKPVSNTLYPDRNLRRYTYKVSYQKVNLGYSFDTMMSSRGCPFNCKFCSFKRNPLGQKRDWSARTPESVINELREINAGVVAFLDDNFFADIKRAERICELIIKEKLNKIFFANARISIAFHPELLKKMYAAGFRLLMIGIESAQDKSLKSLNKGFTTEDVRDAFRVFRKSNMLTNGYFIVGLIGETEREMLEIAPFSKKIGVDFISLNRLRYEKYSGLKDLLEAHRDYYIGESNRIYSKNYGPREINRILKKIRAEFFDTKKIISLIFKGLRIGFPGWIFFLHLPIALPQILLRLKNRKKSRAVTTSGTNRCG
ncbi:B12-binding domain-containing radical SAM protein [Candidatus Latescibacterota bacterium]